jgi:hypothetical protein
MLSVDLLSGDYDANYDYFISERSDAILQAIRINITGPRTDTLRQFDRSLGQVEPTSPDQRHSV